MNVKRRAPGLYRRLQKGFYPTVEGVDGAERRMVGEASTLDVAQKSYRDRVGRLDHPVRMVPRRTTPVFPGIEYLSCMAIAVSDSLYKARSRLISGQRGQCVGRESRHCSVSFNVEGTW